MIRKSLPKRAALVAALVVLVGVAPLAQSTHVNVPDNEVHVHCDALGDPAERVGLDPTEKRWRFKLDGYSPATGRFALDLVSTYEDVMPENTYSSLGDKYSRFTGVMETQFGEHDVALTWVQHPANVAAAKLQQAVTMVLEGTVDLHGRDVPLELFMTFAGASVLCDATVDSFNWLDFCFGGSMSDVCLPVGYEVITVTQFYHNGPATAVGVVDKLPVTAAGTGHGSAHLSLFGAFP